MVRTFAAPHQQGVPQLLHERVKPQGIVGRFEVHRHRSGQPAVEPFYGVRLVGELLLAEVAGVRIKDGKRCFRLCKPQPTNVMRPASFLAALPRSGSLSSATAQGRAHDIGDSLTGTQGQGPLGCRARVASASRAGGFPWNSSPG